MVHKKFFIRILMLVAGVLLVAPRPSKSQGNGERQYLIFTLTNDGLFDASPSKMYSNIDSRVVDLINRVGAITDGKSHQLGFQILIPPWIVDRAFPGKMEQVITESFRVAQARKVAVYFSIESHFFWDTRPDLWNWFDPQKGGYNPENKKNVEWMDWSGRAVKARYAASVGSLKLAPHMCYNSPAVLAEIKRMVSKAFAPAVKRGIDDLKKNRLEHLFAGITVTSEHVLENYEVVDQVSPKLVQLLAKDGMPKARLGYCALTNAGYSQANPPKDFYEALGKINQEFAAYWAKQFADAGVPANRLYTHAVVPVSGSAVAKYVNSPIWTAFNEYSRPGWTTYPEGPLENNFSVIYNELKTHGNPPWASTEGSPRGPGGKSIRMAEYLSRHFDHGAALIVLNSEDVALSKDVFWTREATEAYQHFLGGATNLKQLTPRLANERGSAPAENPQQRVRGKIERIQATLQRWVERRFDRTKINTLATYMQEIHKSLQGGQLQAGEKTADEALRFIAETEPSR